MFIRNVALTIGCAALQFGCSNLSNETDEIVSNLVQAGFPEDDIMVVSEKVYVGRDAHVTLAASREMLAPDASSKEHYRTANQVNPTLQIICIDGTAMTGAFSTGLDQAIQSYNGLGLNFTLRRTPNTGCDFTIQAEMAPGMVGGEAGFPSGGMPYHTIRIGSGLAPYSLGVIKHVIVHELGHTLGLRHTDYYNRGISCGVGGNEGDAGVGAIHIPGTPTEAVAGNSIMNSCFRTSETGDFRPSDATALRTLFPPQAFTEWLWAPRFTPPFHLSADDQSVRDMGARFVDLNGDGRADFVYHRDLDGTVAQKGAYLNTGTGWQWAPQFTPPIPITADNAVMGDRGARFADLNGDGRADLAYHRYIDGTNSQMGAYLNTGNGWEPAPQFTPPFHIVADGVGWLGAAFADLNGDGRDDFVHHRWMNATYQQAGAYLNTGNGWEWAPQFTPPFHLSADNFDVGDMGARLVDLNGDGRADFVYHRHLQGVNPQKGAYLNTGNGWASEPLFTPPEPIASDQAAWGDMGARFADLDGDGRADFVYHRYLDGGFRRKGAYLNTLYGWRWSPDYTPPFHIAAEDVGWLGSAFADLDGDGRDDLTHFRWMNGTYQQTGAYVLK